MKYRIFAVLLALFIAVTVMPQGTNAYADDVNYTQTICPLERNGTALYLSQTLVSGTQPQKQILLVHGVTYSSHEFDIDYQDYSLVRYLARNGYGVWQLDIARGTNSTTFTTSPCFTISARSQFLTAS